MKYIGIDPDIDKNGVAVWDSDNKTIRLFNMSFWNTIDFLSSYPYASVYIEAGWLNKKSNFHFARKQSKAQGERIAKNVGQNHQVGMLILEYCVIKNIKHYTVKPTRAKVSAELFKKITSYGKRTNQEQRDAAMLVYGK
jgi:hypothetical protein